MGSSAGYGGEGDIASASGANDTVNALGGIHDVVYVVGSDGSTASAGTAVDALTGAATNANSDLAAVFFDNGVNATATGGSNLVDILPSSLSSLFDGGSVTAGSSLADMLPTLFGDGLSTSALDSAGTFLADILSGFTL